MRDNKPMSDLNFLIKSNNISLDFLKSALDNEYYHNAEFNFNNLFFHFNGMYDNFFQLLQARSSELLKISYFGENTYNKLSKFFEIHNCSIGMFSDFTADDFSSLRDDKISIDDLTNDEKSLSLSMLKCLVNIYSNDAELGGEIRKIFEKIKQ